MNYREHLIITLQNLIKTEEIIFTNALNLCMFGDLSDSDNAFGENEKYTFNLEILKSVEDINVKKTVKIIELLRENIKSLKNINAITDKEIEYEYDF
jgi:hypothetical protein